MNRPNSPSPGFASAIMLAFAASACIHPQSPDVGTDESTGTEGSTSSGGEMSEPTTGVGVCGDGEVEMGEVCDDGNEADEDGCPSGAQGRCMAVARCGDGIVWEGKEECDDGNAEGGDGCEADCKKTVAVCGNGKVEVGEGCDDGNEEEGDECPSGAKGQCKGVAVCGDGVVWAGHEGCDDGNEVEEDGCPSGGKGQCKGEAACGDGIVWEGKEECDDGNGVDEDGCPSGKGTCQGAECGDGFVWEGKESCDDGDKEDLNGCSNGCEPPRYVFVTSGSGNTGNLGGIAGADAYCQGLAEGAGLPGTYKAWLTGSDPASAPAQRFGSQEFKGWYVLPTQPATGVAQGWADLTSPNEDMATNYLRAPIHVDEGGLDVGNGNAWTNTKSDGTQLSQKSHCGEWMKTSADYNAITGEVAPLTLSEKWTNNVTSTCGFGARLYCFQVE